MKIKRIVPDFESSDMEGSKEFYGGFLGMELVMNQGWVMTFASAANPTAQVTVVERSGEGRAQPDVSVEVDDIELAYSDAVLRGLSIEYPLTTEAWGVTRFFVRDPHGKLVNVMAHADVESSASAG